MKQQTQKTTLQNMNTTKHKTTQTNNNQSNNQIIYNINTNTTQHN